MVGRWQLEDSEVLEPWGAIEVMEVTEVTEVTAMVTERGSTGLTPAYHHHRSLDKEL